MKLKNILTSIWYIILSISIAHIIGFIMISITMIWVIVLFILAKYGSTNIVQISKMTNIILMAFYISIAIVAVHVLGKYYIKGKK